MHKIKIIVLLLVSISIWSCAPSENNSTNNDDIDNTEKMSKKSLLEHIELAINPKYKDWVLFENGTYIIFDNADTIKDVESEAIKLMKEFGPVHAGGPAGDFSVTHLNLTEGWLVSGHGYGKYTYVNPNELTIETPSDIDIGVYGRSKRDMDGNNPKILHVNKK